MYKRNVDQDVSMMSRINLAEYASSQKPTLRVLSFRALLNLVAIVVLCLAANGVFAQESSNAGVVGQITDSSGAVVAAAKVQVLNTGTGAERDTTTNGSGEFSITNLPPATYRLNVEKEGFKKASIQSFDLLVGKVANESVVLNVGSANETVEVTSEAQQLQTTEATVGQVIDQKQISDLPLNGRNVLQLATLAAGVSPAQFANTGTPGQFGTRSLYITVDGGRASSTNYVLDGVYVRSLRFNVLSIQPSVDTLQEFNLLRSSFGTEYGQGQAVVSMVTKSGSNKIHGSAFEYTRSSFFDARNYFSTYSAFPHKPVYHRNQFGGTIGGPVVKDKIFFFAGYEGLRSSQAQPFLGNFPTPAQLGTPSYLFAQVLQPSFPVPNCTTCGSNNYSVVQLLPDNYDQVVVRSDQTLSPKHSLFERYVYYNAAQTVPSVQTATSYPQVGHNVSLGDTYLITNSLVNEVRIGYNRAYGFTNQVNPIPGKNWVGEAGLQNIGGGVNPSEYGRPTVTISGFTALGEGGNSQGDTENIYSAGDTVSDVIGRHTLRVGFQAQYRQITQLEDTPARGSFTFNPTLNPDGTVKYTALQNYQMGICSTCQAGAGSSLGHYTDNTYGVFFNDVWQIGHGLTLNYGLRWEYVSPFVEKDGLAGSFDPGTAQIAFHKVPALLSSIPVALQGNFNTAPNFFPSGIVKPDRRGFGPRIGLAYQATPGTVVRVGYGVYFENTNTNELQFQRNLAPFYFNASFSNQPVQNMIPPLTQVVSLPAPFSESANNRSPYTQEWTASVQQELGHQTLFEITYTGSVSHKLWKRYDQNEDAFATVGGLPGARPYQNFLHGMLTSANEGGANFNGLSAKLEKRSNNGLFYLVNYQWSKNLDNNSGEADSNDTSYSTHFNFDHSYSNYDSPHRVVGSAGYELPFGANKKYLTHGVGNALAGGWQVQPIVQLRAGYPFSVTAGSGSCTCGTYVPQRVNLAPGRSSGKIAHRTPLHYFDQTAYVLPPSVTGSTSVYSGGLSNQQGTVTRNSLRGPGTAQVDFSAIKNFPIFERFTAQFRAEAFNIVNHPNYGNPTANISNSNVGSISSTSFDNRDLQFALKLLW
jgi:hypothetical protein